MGEHVASQRSERHFKQDDHDQTDTDHVQRGVAPMDQYLVHHHLKKQRRDEGEHLQGKADRQNFQQKFAVLDDGGNEPGEIELRHLAGERRTRGEENQVSRPPAAKLFQRQLLRPPHPGELDEHLGTGRVVLGPGQDEELGATLRVIAHRHGGQGCLGKAFGRYVDPLGLQTEFSAGQEHFLSTQGLTVHRKFVGQMRRVRCHVVQACQHDKTYQGGILDGLHPALYGRRFFFLPHPPLPV